MNTKGEKNTIWIYAVILFSCAFMILLLTFYSQEKLQNNTEKLSSKISVVSKANQQTVTNLKTARDQNKKLQEEIESLQKQLDEEKKKASDSETTFKSQIDELSKQNSTDTGVANAVFYYLNKDIVRSADSIVNLDKSTLTGDDIKLYDLIAQKTFYAAAHYYYSRGYNSYSKKNYSDAINMFKKTITFEGVFYFTDDSYMLMANSYFYNGDKDNAKKAFEELVSKYPESEYSKTSESFYKMLE